MSGVAAYLGPDPSAGEPLLHQLAAAQAHRGPVTGTVPGDRLGILQLGTLASVAAGPAPAVDGPCALVLDGALDNAVELRAALIRGGYWPAGRAGGDAELMLAAWRGWGDTGLARCAGRFAVVIADRAAGTLTLARDDLGAKPLYYAHRQHPAGTPREEPPAGQRDGLAAGPAGEPGTVVVASELSALVGTAPAPDDATVHDYLRYGVRPAGERTFYAGVGRVLPGEVVTVAADGALSRRRYGRLRADLATLDRHTRPVDPAARELVEAELRRAVRERLLDGSAVGVPGSLAGYADGHPVLPEPAPWQPAEPPTELGNDLAELLAMVAEPLSGPAGYRQYRVLRSVAGQVTVLLDATGDRALRVEGTAGLTVRVPDLWHRRRFGALLLVLARHPVTAARACWRVLSRRVDRSLGRTTGLVTELLEPDFATRYRNAPAPLARGVRGRVLDGLPAALEFVDRVSTQLSVELRQPLIDAELLRTLWCFDPTPSALPPLRQPAEIGIDTWLRWLDEQLTDVFASGSFAGRGYFQPARVLAAFRAHRSGRGTVDPAVLWRMASVELWLRRWIDQPAPGPAPAKSDYVANPGRELVSANGVWARYPLRVAPIGAETDLAALAAARCGEFFTSLPAEDREALDGQPWYLFVSAAAVAAAQRRSVPAGAVHPSWPARALAWLDVSDPAAVEVSFDGFGPGRVLVAGAAGVLGRALGRPGWAGRVAPAEAAVVRAPRPDAVPPADVCVLRGPADPLAVVNSLSGGLLQRLPAEMADTFAGTVSISADEQRELILGHDTWRTLPTLEAACSGNPLGQSREQTPFAVVVDLRPKPIDWAALDLASRGRWIAGQPVPPPAEVGFADFLWWQQEERRVRMPWQHDDSVSK